MPRKGKVSRFSPGELEILSMLWQRGPLTLAEAHGAFGQFGRPVGYTTMQTRLNRLVEKGAVKRSRRRPARYEAAVRAEDVGVRQIDVLVEKLTRTSIVPLVAHLLSGSSLTPEEIGELKRLIAAMEKSAAQTPAKETKR